MTALLQVRELSTPILGPVTFTLPAGQWCRLQGASGSGKTLLLRALADLDAHVGEVLLHDQSQGQVRAAHWRRQVQYVPTESSWWAPRTGQHFEQRDERVRETLGFPADVWDWPVERLSAGEKQRLALARALAVKPRVLLLDEAWSHVDSERRRVCVSLLERHLDAAGAAIVVSHDDCLPPRDPAVQVRLQACRQVP